MSARETFIENVGLGTHTSTKIDRPKEAEIRRVVAACSEARSSSDRFPANLATVIAAIGGGQRTGGKREGMLGQSVSRKGTGMRRRSIVVGSSLSQKRHEVGCVSR